MNENYTLPNLKNAQKRTHDASSIERSLFHIDEQAKNLGVGRKYFLRTYGCQANERDGQTIRGILEEMGYLPVMEADSADLIILNTCAVRKNAEDKVFGEIGQLKRFKLKNPDLMFVVCGCMAQEEEVVQTILAKHPHIDLIFGTHNIHRLPDLLYKATLTRERVIEVYSQEGDVIENLPSRRDQSAKAWVNIMYGCDKFCTYCIVPYTRGKERSRSKEDILLEIHGLMDEGVKEVTLLGQNVNAYGKDLYGVSSFADLLREVSKTKIDRIRFTTSHPWDFTDELIDVIASIPNVMPYVHLPVQSGNAEILKIMGRRYTPEEYMTLYDKLRTRIKHAAFSTDIIVGFPNETEEQFNDTLNLVDKCRFDSAFTFIYSPREGTPAAVMEDNVPLEEKRRRLQLLNKKVASYALENNRRMLDQTVKVLVDGPSKKDAAVYSGYTENNKLVNFVPHGDCAGEIVEVKITQAKTWTLWGEQIANDPVI
ncbi:MAG: tRNA (N6-isopentenyl adenosine(37)-C2)-methylthiotransferase MiaB [Erysipelotrichaceae bacterium]